MLTIPHEDPEIDAVAPTDAVTTLLELICRTTGLGFAAVARVAETRWIAVRVRDEIGISIKPGSELHLETTIRDRVRQGDAVVIDDGAEDTVFRAYPTSTVVGCASFIAMPVISPDGALIGVLFALDRRPATLRDPATIDTFRLFARLIGFETARHDLMEEVHDGLGRIGNRDAQRDQGGADQQAVGKTDRVLAHDLNNLLTVIQSSADLMQRPNVPDTRRQRYAETIANAAGRAGTLAKALLDQSRLRSAGTRDGRP